MCNFFKLSLMILLVYVLKTVQSNEIPTYKCEHASNGFCYFYNINVTAKDPNFLPTSDQKPVTKVDLGGWHQFGSKVEVLSDDICNVFPELEVLYANSVSLTSINIGALENCNRLTEISFSENKLTHFPFEALAEKKNLTTLWLYSNNFVELDAQKVIKSCIHLTTIYLNDNDISCSKMEKIISIFKLNNVTVATAQDTKVRDYDMASIAGVSCVPDKQWIGGNNSAVNNLNKIWPTYLLLSLVTYYFHKSIVVY